MRTHIPAYIKAKKGHQQREAFYYNYAFDKLAALFSPLLSTKPMGR